MKLVKISIEIFTACQNKIQPFYHPTVFEWKFSCFRFWNKIVFTKKIYWRKNIFSIKTYEIKSDFETNVHNDSECESRNLKCVRFYNWSLRTHENLKGKYFHEINVCGKFCFSKSIPSIILHCKKVKFCIFVPRWKPWKKQKRIWKTSSNKSFKIESDFESAFLQGLQFWYEKLKTCPSSSQFFTTRQSLNWDFYSVFDFV